MDIYIRTLEKSDISKGFLDALNPLFKVGLSVEEAEAVYERISKNPDLRILVAELCG